MGSKEVNSLPFHLELEEKVNASTQNQDLSALLVQYREPLERSLQIMVRHGKGGKDRRTMLPARIAEKLQAHLEEGRPLHRQDLAEGYGRLRPPHALACKYPHAAVRCG